MECTRGEPCRLAVQGEALQAGEKLVALLTCGEGDPRNLWIILEVGEAVHQLWCHKREAEQCSIHSEEHRPASTSWRCSPAAAPAPGP